MSKYLTAKKLILMSVLSLIPAACLFADPPSIPGCVFTRPNVDDPVSSKLVIVGNKSTILTSDDGTEWKVVHDVPANLNLNTVAYGLVSEKSGHHEELTPGWVAGGEGGLIYSAGNRNKWESATYEGRYNGKAWPTKLYVAKVAWVKGEGWAALVSDSSRFYQGDYAGNTIITSIDGKVWKFGMALENGNLTSSNFTVANDGRWIFTVAEKYPQMESSIFSMAFDQVGKPIWAVHPIDGLKHNYNFGFYDVQPFGNNWYAAGYEEDKVSGKKEPLIITSNPSDDAKSSVYLIDYPPLDAAVHSVLKRITQMQAQDQTIFFAVEENFDVQGDDAIISNIPEIPPLQTRYPTGNVYDLIAFDDSANLDTCSNAKVIAIGKSGMINMIKPLQESTWEKVDSSTNNDLHAIAWNGGH